MGLIAMCKLALGFIRIQESEATKTEYVVGEACATSKRENKKKIINLVKKFLIKH